MAGDEKKAEMVPYTPEVMEKGKYKSEDPVHKKQDVKLFHTYRKEVQTPDGPHGMIVDVAQRKNSQLEYSVYSMTHEGTPEYEKRMDKEKETADPSVLSAGRNRLIHDGTSVFVEPTVSPIFEVVNLRWADEPGNF